MFLQYIHSFGSLVEPQQAVTDVISGPLSCPDVCVCRPSRPLTLAVVNSWQGQKSPQTLLASLSSHLFLLPCLRSSCSPSFSHFFFFLWHSSNSPWRASPSRSRSGPTSYISDSLGTSTTSTCSSADVRINQGWRSSGAGGSCAEGVRHTRHLYIPTSELVDSGLLCHIGEGNDALWKVTRCLIHFNESMRTHVATGIVSYVDSITSCALGKKNNK